MVEAVDNQNLFMKKWVEAEEEGLKVILTNQQEVEEIDKISTSLKEDEVVVVDLEEKIKILSNKILKTMTITKSNNQTKMLTRTCSKSYLTTIPHHNPLTIVTNPKTPTRQMASFPPSSKSSKPTKPTSKISITNQSFRTDVL